MTRSRQHLNEESFIREISVTTPAMPEVPSDYDEDLLFDPLLHDEPINLAEVRREDALIDAIGAAVETGDTTSLVQLANADDVTLLAMLIAWAASARP